MNKLIAISSAFTIVGALAWWLTDPTIKSQQSDQFDSVRIATPTRQVQPAGGHGDRQPAKASVDTRALEAPVNAHVRAWKKFGDAYKEDFGVVKHRAAVTGNLVDIAAALAYEQRCISRALAPVQYYEDGGIKLPDQQRQMLEVMHARCYGAAGVINVNVKDSAGFKGDADMLVRAVRGTTIKDADMRRQVADFVRETKSASLLEAVAPALMLRGEGLYEIGLNRSNAVPPSVDQALAGTAIKLWACEERGDCAGMGNLNPMCAAFNVCVDDFRDYPARHLFGDIASRSFDIRSSDNLTPEQIKQRWLLIQQLIRSRYS